MDDNDGEIIVVVVVEVMMMILINIITSGQEIRTLNFKFPNTLFTGRKDGHFSVWAINSVSCRASPNLKPRARKQTP
eukprot:2040821-Rhodomonas_salina.1